MTTLPGYLPFSCELRGSELDLVDFVYQWERKTMFRLLIRFRWYPHDGVTIWTSCRHIRFRIMYDAKKAGLIVEQLCGSGCCEMGRVASP